MNNTIITGQVIMGNAESWKWDAKSNIYLPSAIITSNPTQKKLSIAYKNGTTEVLTGNFTPRTIGAQTISFYMPEKIISSTGRELTLHWDTTDPQDAPPRLKSIADETKILLTATYKQNKNTQTTTLNIFPNTPESYSLTFDIDSAANPWEAPTLLKKVHNSKTDDTTSFSHSSVAVSKYRNSVLINEIKHNSTLTENIVYTEGKVSKHSIKDTGNSTTTYTTLSNIYAYRSDDGIVITTVTEADGRTTEYHYTSNGLPIRESTWISGVLVKIIEVNRAEVKGTKQLTSALSEPIPDGLEITTTTTYLDSTPVNRFERSVIRFDTLGNIVSKTENGITTEWTYYQGGANEKDLVTTQRVQAKGFLATVVAIFEYSSPIGWGFLLFAKRGLTWGTAETHSITKNPISTNNGKQKFNLPVAISCPGDPNYFCVYTESERTYTVNSSNQRTYLSCTYFGYSSLSVRSNLTRGPAVKPSTKLTVYNPQSDNNGKLTSWQSSQMVLEEIRYIDNVTSRDHGRVASSQQSNLDVSGSVIPESIQNTTFNYSYAVPANITNDALVTTTTITIGGSSIATLNETRAVLTGQLLSSTDSFGNISDYKYDTRGRTIYKTDSALGFTTNIVTAFTYTKNSQGSSVERTSPAGEITRESFDTVNRHIKTERQIPNGGRWLTQLEKVYGNLGRVDSITEYDYHPDGTNLFTRTRTIKYDAWGSESEIKWSDGTTQGFDYDDVWQTSTHWTSFGSQSTALTTFKDKPLNSNVQHESFRSTNGQRLSSRSSTYDANTRLIRETSSEGPDLEFSYDAFGRPKRIAIGKMVIDNEYSDRTKASTAISASVHDKLNPSNSKLLGTRLTDGLGRVIQSDIGGRTIQFIYKGVSQWGKSNAPRNTFQQANSCTVTVNHDPLNNKTSETTTGDATPGSQNATSTVNYIRSMRGVLLSETDAFSNTATYVYNTFGKLLGSSNASCQMDLSFNADNLLTSETLTDRASLKTMKISYTHDVHQRETQRTFECPGFRKLTLTVEYNKKNKISKIKLYQDTTLLRGENFTYDEQERLTSYSCIGPRKPRALENVPLENQTYTYDIVGNLEKCINTSSGQTFTNTFTYDATDPTRLNKSSRTKPDQSISACTFLYDLRGNLIDNNGIKLTYNNTNKLGTISNTNGSFTYFYNNVGQVVGCQGTGFFENYFYKGDEQYARQGSFQTKGQSIQRTSVLLNQSHSCLLQKNTQSINGAPPTISSSFELKDVRGSVIASYNLLDDSITFFDYTPFGYRPYDWEHHSWIGFSGQPIDRVSGCYALGNGIRIYDPAHERYQSPDEQYSPFGAGGVNNRNYCHNDPINFSDPSGHAEIVNQYTVISQAPLIEDPVVQAVLIGAIGIALAPFTGGSSVGWAVAATGLAIVSAGFGIASAALQKSDPQLADAFDWLSLGTGFASAGFAVAGGKIGTRAALTSARYVENNVPLSQRVVQRAFPRRGGVPAGQITDGTVHSVQSGMAVSSTFELYSGGVSSRILYIDAHGTAMQAQHLLPPQTAEFQFRSALGVKAADVGTNWQERVLGRTPYRHAPGANNIPNYILDEFTLAEHLHVGTIPASATQTPQQILSNLAQLLQADILRPTSTVLLSDLLNELTRQGFTYDRIVGNFCRGNMPYNTSEFEQIIRRTLGFF